MESMTLRELPLAVALASSFAFAFAFTACSDDEEPPTPAADASVQRDASVTRDAAANPDAASRDAANADAVVTDTGQADAGTMDALPGDAAEVTLTALAFQPATLSIVSGETRQLLVVGTYSDSSTAAVTTGLTFASSDETRATVSAEGLLTAVSGGPLTITARSGNLTAMLSVTVTAPLRPMFPDIFLDDYTADLSFMEFGGSTNAITVDTTVQHSGAASLRVEVPAGGYTGGAIRSATAVDGSPFDAVSFWARASAPHTLNVVGIGNDAATAVLQAEWNAVALTTTWTRYVLPLPNPARFTAQTGVFHFAEGSDEGAYTIWFDDIRYESLGSAVIGVPQPAIATEQIPRAVGETHAINGASVTFPVNGTNQTLAIARSWLNFTSSNPAVATVAADGVATAVGPGTADITATLGTTAAAGRTTLVVSAPTLPTVAAPTPTALAANVISLFSNAYTNVAVDTWSAPWDQADVADVQIAGNDTKRYSNINFVGIEFVSAPIDATAMTHFHMDVWTANSTTFTARLVDFGPNGTFGGGDDTESSLDFGPASTPPLTSSAWVSLDLPLASFTGLAGRTRLAQIVLVANNSGTVYVDNVYFRR